MAGNEQLIDQVISPVVDAQVEGLTKMLADLDIQMSQNIKSANLLNATTSNSKSFAEYSKNATQTALALEKIQQAQNKTAQTTIDLNAKQAKLAADQQARDEKSAQQLAQKQARQAAADAKEIAAAEAKAAKLQAIQDEAARKAAVQFPPSQSAPNPVTQDTGSVRYEPTITGNENMAITATKSTEAIAAENAALLEQQEVLGSLTVTQRANIETLLALQAERAANAAELKVLNVEDAASGERAIFLTAEQLKLKVAISEVTMELNRQTKEMLAEDGATKQLGQSVLLLREAYDSLAPAERNSEQGQKQLVELQALDKEYKALKISTGDTSKEVGAYEKAIAKATNGTQLAATAVNIATRSIIRMIVQFALFGVILQAAVWIYDYIKSLSIFIDVATQAEMTQKGLADAFASSDYQKGLENVLQLSANLELAKKGIENSDTAINQYNETLGKTFGYVTNVNDAQQGFIDHKDAYIQTILDEAAANAIANDAAKQAAEIALKNQQLREDIARRNKDISDVTAHPEQSGVAPKPFIALQNKLNKEDLAEIKANSDKVVAIFTNAKNAIEGLDSGAIAAGGQKTGSDAIAELRNKIANEALEHQKILDQKIISDEKQSYKARLNALADFYKSSKQILDNNEALALKELPANDARREDIEKDAANKLLSLQEQTGTQRRQLLDKQYKQDQEILKNNIQKQLDLFKQVSEDPNQSYDMKLIALDVYAKKSRELIQANYKEQVKEAGKNSESIKIAEQNKDKAIIQLENETAQDRLKIQKENLAKILEASKESEQDQLEVLQNGANLALRALTEARDMKENALSLERAKGKISERRYNEELLAINDQFAIDRIKQEINTQKLIIAAKEGYRDSTISRMQIDGATPEQISKFTSGANKDIQPNRDKLAGLTNDLTNAGSKSEIDDANKKAREKQEIEDKAAQLTIEAIDSIDTLRQKAYENEIKRLEKIGEQIDENANNEKQIVNDSILSSATKARQIALIDAQAASKKKALIVEENKIKHQQDIADKEATIAKIIVNGSLAIVKAFAEGGPILEALAIATVAVELATAIATPLPKYATGTTNYPGGLGIWGEEGMERATLPSGEVRYSNGPEIANFPRGTVITPHMQLMQQIKPDSVKFAGGEEIGWREVIKQLKKMEPKNSRSRVVVNVDTGFESYKRGYLRR